MLVWAVCDCRPLPSCARLGRARRPSPHKLFSTPLWTASWQMKICEVEASREDDNNGTYSNGGHVGAAKASTQDPSNSSLANGRHQDCRSKGSCRIQSCAWGFTEIEDNERLGLSNAYKRSLSPAYDRSISRWRNGTITSWTSALAISRHGGLQAEQGSFSLAVLVQFHNYSTRQVRNLKSCYYLSPGALDFWRGKSNTRQRHKHRSGWLLPQPLHPGCSISCGVPLSPRNEE
jgi:hypothetical protein